MLPSFGEAAAKMQSAVSQLLGPRRDRAAGQEPSSFRTNDEKVAEMERAVVLP